MSVPPPRKPTPTLHIIAIVIAVTGGFCALIALGALANNEQNTKVGEVLVYLNDTPGVAWWLVDGDDVYIGLRSKEDSKWIALNAAAVGSKAIDGDRFRAWTVAANEREQFPPNGKTFYYHNCAHAHYGKTRKVEGQ